MHPTLKIKASKSASLSGKRIILGITGSIAAVKCVALARELLRHGADVLAVMSPWAQEIISAEAMHYATGRKPVTRLSGAIEHVRECGSEGIADLLLIAPATANTIGKIAQGIDDTTVTTFASTALGSKVPMIVVPAMHSSMYESRAVQRNMKQLEKDGVVVVSPIDEESKAKFPEIEEIVLECERAVGSNSFEGKKVVVSSGATQEEIDDVRVLTNKASGRTGRALAREFYRRGAEVVIIHDHGAVASGIRNVRVKSAQEMENALLKECKNADMFIAAAAMGDFDVEKKKGKISSSKAFSISLRPRAKTIAKIRKNYPNLFIFGFKAEANVSEKELEKIARAFLEKNSLQAVCANDVGKHWMGGGENEVLMLSKTCAAKAKGLKERIVDDVVDFVQGVFYSKKN